MKNAMVSIFPSLGKGRQRGIRGVLSTPGKGAIKEPKGTNAIGAMTTMMAFIPNAAAMTDKALKGMSDGFSAKVELLEKIGI